MKYSMKYVSLAIFLLNICVTLPAFAGPNEDLIAAAEKGDIGAVRASLAKGADINVKRNNEAGATALIVAAYNGHTDVVQILLTKGADINAKMNDGTTILMCAAYNGHTDIVHVLLSKGVDVNAKSDIGMTALMVAAQNGHADIVKALLSKGVDVNAKSNRGITALMLAESKGHDKIVELLEENNQGEYAEVVITPSGAQAQMSGKQKYTTQFKDQVVEGEVIAMDPISFPRISSDGKTNIWSSICLRTAPNAKYIGSAEELLSLLVPGQETVDDLSRVIIKEGTSSKGGIVAVIEPFNDGFKATAGDNGMHINFNLGGGKNLGTGLLTDVVSYKREVKFLPGTLTMVKKDELMLDPQTREFKKIEDRTFSFVFGENASISFDEKAGKIVMKNIQQK